MELRTYRLHFITYACGHTRSVITIAPLTRQEIYRRAGGLCSRCQRLQQDADNAAPASAPVRAEGPRRKTRAVYKRYEGAYQDLYRMYPAGRVPLAAFASHLGIGTNPVYRWFKNYAAVTNLRIVNGKIFRKGE